VNYAVDIAKIRAARDRTIERARADGRRKLADVAAARDTEIRALAEDGMRLSEIAVRVGCSRGQAYEVLNPERRAKYNARRRAHWHVLPGGRAA
jgi:DNA invertase Pin-like site-specific DNA recombinase